MLMAMEDSLRRRQLKWVDAVMEYRGWTQTYWARLAGVSPSGLSKFINDPLNKAQLAQRTMDDLAKVAGIPVLATNMQAHGRGFSEGEATPYAEAGNEGVAGAIAAFTGGRSGTDPWIMQSDALELAGVLRGDILVVDMNARPIDGDVVCAQIYNRHGTADTVFRIYEHPYLVASCSDPRMRRPALIEDNRALVRGVVIATVRARAA